LVLLKGACGAAGSSMTDTCDIGIREAGHRVTDYARPFISSGVACYYANNWDNYIPFF
jgi:hypothetical protein